MRILVVSPLYPTPPYTGGALRIVHLLRALASEHTVTLLAAASRSVHGGEAFEESSPVIVRRVPCGWTPGDPPTWSKRWAQARSLLSRRSALFWTFAAPLHGALRSIDWGSYDAVQAEYSVLGLLPFPPRLPLVLDSHNLEYRVLERAALYATSWRRLWLAWETQRVRRDERTAWSRARVCLATSPVDGEEIGRSARGAVAIVPNGVDLRALPFADLAVAEPYHVVFVGTYRYQPNVDAVLWFVRSIWPRIRAHCPSASCSLVGLDPPPAVQALSGLPGIRVIGTVPDVRPWLARASVVVVPLRAGSGTRLKILEAFAAGRPVVSTSIGVEGLAVEPGRHVLVADDPVEFAQAVVRLLEDTAARRALALAARQLVESEYTWERIGAKLLAIYRGLGEEQGRGAT